MGGEDAEMNACNFIGFVFEGLFGLLPIGFCCYQFICKKRNTTRCWWHNCKVPIVIRLMILVIGIGGWCLLQSPHSNLVCYFLVQVLYYNG